MRALILLLGLLIAGPAWGQWSNYTPPYGASMPVRPTGGTSSMPLGDYLAARPVDVRSYIGSTGASCATNIAPAVDAAVAAGVTSIFLPGNCTYIPDNPSNVLPGGVSFVGQSDRTTIISVANRAIDVLSIGSLGSIQNVGVISKFCDQNATPFGTQKICSISGQYLNQTGSQQQLNYWGYANLVVRLGPVNDPNGVALTGLQGIVLLGNTAGGDNIYTSTSAGSLNAGVHAVTSASGGGDVGLLTEDGYGDTSNADGHSAVRINEYSNNNNANTNASIYINRIGQGGGTEQSVFITDTSAASGGNSSPWINLSVQHQQTGALFQIFGGTDTYGGSAILENMGNSGTFNGNFIRFQIAGSTLYNVASSGLVQETVNLIGTQANALSAGPTGAVSAIENLKFATAGDQYVRAAYQLSASGSSTTAIRPTTDGTGTASTTNCGNLTSNNDKAVLHDIVMNATDETAPGNDYAWVLSAAQITRYTGVGSTVFHEMGTPVTSSNGTVTGASVSATADTTNACMNLSFTPPTGNTDTWRVTVSFLKDRAQ